MVKYQSMKWVLNKNIFSCAAKDSYFVIPQIFESIFLQQQISKIPVDEPIAQ